MKGVDISNILKGLTVKDVNVEELKVTDVEASFIKNTEKMLNKKIGMKKKREKEQEQKLERWIAKEKERRFMEMQEEQSNERIRQMEEEIKKERILNTIREQEARRNTELAQTIHQPLVIDPPQDPRPSPPRPSRRAEVPATQITYNIQGVDKMIIGDNGTMTVTETRRDPQVT